MTLRDQILTLPETLSDFSWSAEQRFRDAEELISQRRFSGAVYLLGLSAEMWLKLAALRHLGGLPSSIVAGFFGPIIGWMRTNLPTIRPESNHSLLYWAEYIIGVRAAAGLPLPAFMVGDLRHHVCRRLYEDWRIDLRYRSLPVTERHAWRVYNDVAWIRDNWQKLWRS